MARRRSLVVGWREWVALPDLEIRHIKAKVDTGARSSSLHAFQLEVFQRRGRDWVRFKVHPLQRNSSDTVQCEAVVAEFRNVTSSSGHSQQRPVIISHVEFQDDRWPIEITLANRDSMGFRMLLGREALRGRFLVDPGQSFLGGTRKKRKRRH